MNNYKKEKLIFNIFFDKEKKFIIYFSQNEISYSNIKTKIYILPIFEKREDDYYF